MPFATEHSPELAAHTVGDDQPVAVDSRGVLLRVGEHDSDDATARITFHVGCAHSLNGCHAGFQGDLADGLGCCGPGREGLALGLGIQTELT